MTDRELLESAARAAGIVPHFWNDGSEPYSSGPGLIIPGNRIWNPLENDGDALRLAVSCGIELNVDKPSRKYAQSAATFVGWMEWARESHADHNGNAGAATRRAITRAAAAIGEKAPA